MPPITLLVSQYHNLHRVAYLQGSHVIDVDLEWPPSIIAPLPCLNQIYWGRVFRCVAGHAFVKLAEGQIGLLPIERLFPQLHEGQSLLVQIRREAMPDKGTPHKGPLLTRNITLGGRYCLYHPFQEKRSFSSKIQDPTTRNRLQTLIPNQTPVTLREAAARASHSEILAEIANLQRQFLDIEALSNKAPCRTPYGALPSSHRWMRDLSLTDGNKILVDNDLALIDTRHFLKTHRPDLLPCVHKSREPLFESYGLEEFWESLFQDVVALPSGGNIAIDATAAAIVIDVNQGDGDARETNKEAISLIAQHLKGRHLGGNIIIDFMGLDASCRGRDTLTDLLVKEASRYNLPLDIFGWSKLGWLEARLPKRRVSLRDKEKLRIRQG